MYYCPKCGSSDATRVVERIPAPGEGEGSDDCDVCNCDGCDTLFYVYFPDRTRIDIALDVEAKFY